MENSKKGEPSEYFEEFKEYGRIIDEITNTELKTFKISNTIRVDSKRMIFSCHRIFIENKNEDVDHEQIRKKYQLMTKGYEKIFSERFRSNLENIAETPQEFFHLFHRKLVASLQEYFESCMFYHFLRHGKVMKYDTLCKKNPFLPVITINDYICGLYDLTGEMMRYAVNSAVQKKNYEATFSVCDFLQKIYMCLMGMEMSGRDRKKQTHMMRTLSNSLKKVERVCYSVQLRREEKIDDAFRHEERRNYINFDRFGDNKKNEENDDGDDGYMDF